MQLPEIKGKYEFKHVGNVYKSPNECLTAVASGAVQISYSGPAFLEQFNPNWKAASAPGIFEDFEHFQRTVDTPPWQKMVRELEEKQNIKMIKWIGSLGSFMLFTNKPIQTVEDVAGLRIRYNGATGYAAALAKFRTTPVALPFTEVVSALQTNMIDGLISEIQAAPWYDLPRYAGNLVPITWVSSPMCLIVNAKWWIGLDKDSKEIFTYALMTPSTYQFLDADEARQIEEWGTVTPNTRKSSLRPRKAAAGRSFCTRRARNS
ncbi:MAG: TRAP transporter substrate-binding protein DctP [Bilophila sp.]